MHNLAEQLLKHHPRLLQQIEQYNLSLDDLARLSGFLGAIDQEYAHQDKSQQVLEKSIELSANELNYHNRTLKLQLQTLEATKNALQESNSMLEASLNATHEALLGFDLFGNIRLFNSNFRSLFGLDGLTRAPQSLNDFIALAESRIEQPSVLIREIRHTLANPTQQSECEFRTTLGRTIECYSNPQWLGQKVAGQVWSFRDISELKLKEEEARHRAYHDILTGLPNRRLLSLRLNQALQQDAQHGRQTIVLFMDLDGFKDVNDSLGHSVGDALLKDVSMRLESLLPRNTTLYRHGGDEFVAIMEGQYSTLLAEDFASRTLEAFHSAFPLGDEDVYISTSIGIAVAPQHGTDTDKLVAHADIAMYQAKQKGKNTFKIYQPDREAMPSHRLKIRNQLNIALEQDEFELFFQPKISLESGTIKGAEALIRWRPDGGDYRSPIEFIPIAEESGQIVPISQWVIRRCCQHLNDWKEFLPEDFVLALNISAKHFQRGKLQSDMAIALTQFSVPASQLELEVTETAIMDDVDLAVETLNELKRLGIRTAIDDFGTGHSSLSYLRKLPIEILKIDKSFIDEILSSKEDRTLVKGIIDMVHALGIQVVAEGVENHEMAVLLHEMRCDLVQGYHYCRPICEAEFIELIKRRQCYL